MSKPPVFRFAPSPNGALHLGHALSALLNQSLAKEAGGRLLLRMEDIDVTRCRPEYETAALTDLAWLGLSWEEPIRRQSEHFADYEAALQSLIARGLVYPSFLSRGEIRALVTAAEAKGAVWPRDPDGAPHYPGLERNGTSGKREAGHRQQAWRLDMRKALAEIRGPLTWRETGAGPGGETGVITADASAWGDVVLSRPDAPSSYHLSVVVDDALQGVTHVVRGRDLFHATAVHRLLQVLLDLPEPVYHHHRLILGPDGRKLSKSLRDTGLSVLRQRGWSLADVRAALF